VQTVTDKGPLQCVIEHPGFQASCLNRWSLELATGNYKTRDGHRYSQSGSNFKGRVKIKSHVFLYKYGLQFIWLW
jgi:hypothetical protein